MPIIHAGVVHYVFFPFTNGFCLSKYNGYCLSALKRITAGFRNCGWKKQC